MDCLNFYLKISKPLMNKMLCSKSEVWYTTIFKIEYFRSEIRLNYLCGMLLMWKF